MPHAFQGRCTQASGEEFETMKRGANGRATDEFGDSTTDRPRRGRTSLGNELPSRVAPS